MDEFKVVGQSVKREDTREKVTGEAQYSNDVTMPGTLHLKLVFADRPHAKILSIDTDAAVAFPGVVAVFTGADVPQNIYGLIHADQQVLCDEKVLFVGDQVCAVVAETMEQAIAGAKLIKVDYQDLPVISTPAEAMQSGAVTLHKDYPDNILSRVRLRKGDADVAMAEADVVVTRAYTTPVQEHAYLEPEAGIAYMDEEGRVTVRTAGQCTHDDLRQIAHALDLPIEKTRVIYGAIGGAFGGREDISVQIVLALAAWKLQRPVKTVWSRAESIKGHGKRHEMVMKYTWGAMRDGTLVAAKMEITADAGAYESTSKEVLNNACSFGIGPYQIPNVSVDGVVTYTNNVPGAAFRGFGAPQTGFAAELQIEHLAEELGLDPVTIRLKNCLRDNSILATQSPIPDVVSLPELLEICAKELGAEQHGDHWHMPTTTSDNPYKKRGIGLAAGFKNTGFGFGFPEGSDARVVLHGDAIIERVEVFTAAADVGQGAHSALAQIAAEVLDVPLAMIEMVTSDTATAGNSGPASASRLTFFAGHAVKWAAEQALQDFKDESRPAEGGGWWAAPPTEAPDPETYASFHSISYAYGAQAVEVEVDLETGLIDVLNVIAVHDPGKAVNPQQVEGQIHGAVVQSLGWALTENYIAKEGYVETDNFSTYLIPTVLDIPQTEKTILYEKPDPAGPFGVRGVGEIPYIGIPPAIISAVHDATGVWFDRIPLTAEQVALALKDKLEKA